MSKKYQKLGADEDAGDSKELDLSTAAPDQLNPSSGIEMQVKTFSVKILLKEAHLPLAGLTDLSTVGQLKIEIEKLTNVAPHSQRLIFAGKQLKVDDKTMKSFNIVENSSIHLFPIPPKPVVVGETPTATAIPTPSTMNALSDLILPAYPIPHSDQSIHFDPEISQHCREVRLWSVILIFLSTMTLFNYFSNALSTGKMEKILFLSFTDECSSSNLIAPFYSI